MVKRSKLCAKNGYNSYERKILVTLSFMSSIIRLQFFRGARPITFLRAFFCYNVTSERDKPAPDHSCITALISGRVDKVHVV